jgi:hypothetical protein
MDLNVQVISISGAYRVWVFAKSLSQAFRSSLDQESAFVHPEPLDGMSHLLKSHPIGTRFLGTFSAKPVD